MATASKPGGPRHDVVDGRGDAGMLGRRGAHGGGREGRHRDGQSDAEEDDGREDLGEVAPAVRGPGQEEQAGSDHERSRSHLQPGTDPRRQLARTRREDQHDRR